LRLPEFIDSWPVKVARLSALCNGLLYPQEIPLVLTAVGVGVVDPMVIVHPRGLSHSKIPVTTLGTESATFRFVA